MVLRLERSFETDLARLASLQKSGARVIFSSSSRRVRFVATSKKHREVTNSFGEIFQFFYDFEAFHALYLALLTLAKSLINGKCLSARS